MIKQKAQHFIRPLPEMRDHTQENRKRFAKKRVFEKFFLLELSGGKNVFWQRINSRILSKIFVRDFFGSKSRIRGSVTLKYCGVGVFEPVGFLGPSLKTPNWKKSCTEKRTNQIPLIMVNTPQNGVFGQNLPGPKSHHLPVMRNAVSARPGSQPG